MYAHIYKAKGGLWQLFITPTESLEGAITHSIYSSKQSAKAVAKLLGAKPHNY